MSHIKLSDLLNLILITADTPKVYVIIRDEKTTEEMMVTRIEISETHKQLVIFCENGHE